MTTKDEWRLLFGGEVEIVAYGSGDSALRRAMFVGHPFDDDGEFIGALTDWRDTAALRLRDAFPHDRQWLGDLLMTLKVVWEHALRLRSAEFELPGAELDDRMGTEMIRAIRAGEIDDWRSSWPVFSLLLGDLTDAGIVRKMAVGFAPGRSHSRYLLPLRRPSDLQPQNSVGDWNERIVVDKHGHHLHADSYLVRAAGDRYAKTVMVEVAFDGLPQPYALDAQRLAWNRDEHTSRLVADAGFGPNIPDGYRVVDGCGKKTCVRPDHLLCLPNVYGWWSYQREVREGICPTGFAAEL
jgi:hypothetical protein